MSRIDDIIKNQMKSDKTVKVRPIPEFSSDGKVIKRGNSILKKRILTVILVLCSIYVVFYAPGLFMRDKKDISNNMVLDPDTSSIKLYNDMMSKSQSNDFDGDGLDNSTEENYSTNIWSRDSDNDGADDYYEIYVSKTSPTEYNKDILIDIQKKSDKEKGDKVDTPYKCGNVILWAKDYESKAKGGVIETPLGYHFTDFNGYAQFAENNALFAYTNDNGKYEPLTFNDKYEVWNIDNYHNVVMFSSPLEEIVAYKFFGKPVYAKDNFFHTMMVALLPSRSFISANKMTREDVEPTMSFTQFADNYNISYDKNNYERLSKKTNTLNDLQFVRSMIDENKCVAVSLFNENVGEVRCIINGYNEKNDLFVIDEETYEDLGVIHINEVARKSIDKNGNYAVNTYFTWYGLGFSSDYGDRISFFSVAGSSANFDVKKEAEKVESTPTDATPSEPTPTDSIETSTPTEAEYVAPILHTGSFEHTHESFISIISRYPNYKDNTENKKGEEPFKEFIDANTISGLAFYETDNKDAVAYLWINDHANTDIIYDKFKSYYSSEGSFEDEEGEIYKESKIQTSDGASVILRKYTDDIIIIFYGKNGINEELSNIDNEIGKEQN